MRKMVRRDGDNAEHTVYEHIMTCDLCSYYVLEETEADIKRCLVWRAMSEPEVNYVSMSEIEQYVMKRTKDLSRVASSWYKWVD